MWRSSIGMSRSLSAGLPASITTSRIKPLRPVVRFSLTVLDVAAALDDNVGMALERADQLVAGRHRLAAEHPPLALRDHPLDQWLIVTDLGPPESDGRLRRPGKPRRSFAQIGQSHTGDLDQFTVERHPFGPSSRELNGLP